MIPKKSTTELPTSAGRRGNAGSARRASGRLAAILCSVVAIAMVTGCAAELKRAPTPLDSSRVLQERPLLRLREQVQVSPESGYARTVPAPSEWRYAGTTPQGDVYRPIGRVFTIEGANAHEAYLVVAGGELVGFFLPGEGAFAPLTARVRLFID